jgi:hypothetical protein
MAWWKKVPWNIIAEAVMRWWQERQAKKAIEEAERARQEALKAANDPDHR